MLWELVRTAAGQAPDRPLVICEYGRLTYGDSAQRAEATGTALRERGVDRFGCLFASPADTILALISASLAGSEACVYPGDPGPERHRRLAERFEHRTVLTDQPGRFEGLDAVTLAELESGASARTIEPPEHFPVLILTTGTTGEQKGARHDWERLVRAVRRCGLASGTRWLLAYNLNQFAGIQVLLHALAGAGTLVEPASRRPSDVIAAIRSQRVTHVSATPTFWRLLAGRLDWRSARKLPLEQITLGGEAASEGLLARLRELFPQAGISHVYAGSEFGSVVSVRDGHSGLPASVLDRGEDADVRFRIVDGELQIRSRLGMLGYHRGNADDGEWWATGDLVELRDGRIQFIGRTSEIINVGGAKVHPLPVEERVCAIDGVELAAVYGRPNPVTGQIVAVDVVPAPAVETAELEFRIREALEALPPAARPRRIRFVPELEIRGSKLMRREAPSQ